MANNLRSLRRSRNWTQEETAAALGTTRSQYVKLEIGSRRLTDGWIERAAAAFGVDTAEIVTNGVDRRWPIRGCINADGTVRCEPSVTSGPPGTRFALLNGACMGQMFIDWVVGFELCKPCRTYPALGLFAVDGYDIYAFGRSVVSAADCSKVHIVTPSGMLFADKCSTLIAQISSMWPQQLVRK